MNARAYEQTKKMPVSKMLFILALSIAGIFAANSTYSQVHVNVGIGVPAPVIYESDYPGYVYYGYPAWRGHYRDRYYYEHYRPVFEREHRAYFVGRRFDHERFERERHWRGGGRGPARGHHRGHGHDDNRH